MENSKFEQEVEHWIYNVYKKCNELGQALNKDYYPFQCSKKSLQQGVELLIIGANPGGNKPFPIDKTINRLFSCGEDGSNAYIAYKDDPEWKINRPILEIFSTPNLRKVLENAVIMNAVYFNTYEVKDLSLFPNKKDAISFCIEMTKEFINILKPKVILILGFDVPKWLNIQYNKEENRLLFSDETKKSALVFEIKGEIPTYIIHHPSRNYKFNSKENLNKKQEVFEKILNKKQG